MIWAILLLIMNIILNSKITLNILQMCILRRKNWRRTVPLGEGDTNFNEIINTLIDLGYKSNFTIQIT